jgi:uncharacterized membrane protein YgcG
MGAMNRGQPWQQLVRELQPDIVVTAPSHHCGLCCSRLTGLLTAVTTLLAGRAPVPVPMPTQVLSAGAHIFGADDYLAMLAQVLYTGLIVYCSSNAPSSCGPASLPSHTIYPWLQVWDQYEAMGAEEGKGTGKGGFKRPALLWKTQQPAGCTAEPRVRVRQKRDSTSATSAVQVVQRGRTGLSLPSAPMPTSLTPNTWPHCPQTRLPPLPAEVRTQGLWDALAKCGRDMACAERARRAGGEQAGGGEGRSNGDGDGDDGGGGGGGQHDLNFNADYNYGGFRERDALAKEFFRGRSAARHSTRCSCHTPQCTKPVKNTVTKL